ncbi:HNH endonuclease signature motif containing protein [Actinobacillus equuli]|uniref:HNH endonuclease signature motif containing protein n=1 Tax=Actinobacillus equuli TaxID=718 RepID=UPI00241870B2|nr:HNH endonuclease signature motif containing protein [Actinobacillus equuli]MDG4952777.1 HNH endonuclease [Actinobacillus equuli subsp. equuli]
MDGYNGLLLAPHIDKLFDNGYISFEDDGQLIVSPHLSEQILFEWNIKRELNVGKFKSQQKLYLDYHRKNIFKN